MREDLMADQISGPEEAMSHEGTTRQGAVLTAHAIVVALLGGLLACAPNHAASDVGRPGGMSTPAEQAAAPDTLRGLVAVVGAEPGSWVVLRPATGGPEITLQGDPVRELRRLSGVEVQVEGQAGAGGGAVAGPPGASAGRSFTVQRFAVLAVDGIPAVDGVLEIEDDVAYLILTGGDRIRIAHLPAALRDQSGARVWLAGPLEGEIQAFGVIREAGA
jgi:hypothetical protein